MAFFSVNRDSFRPSQNLQEQHKGTETLIASASFRFNVRGRYSPLNLDGSLPGVARGATRFFRRTGRNAPLRFRFSWHRRLNSPGNGTPLHKSARKPHDDNRHTRKY
jgi:hypothetical protein